MGHITCNFLSYTLHRDITVNVILPTLVSPEISWTDPLSNTHQHKAKYPVLYLLHGGINDYSSWERYTSIERYAEANQIAVVTFSAENKSYDNWEGSVFSRDYFYDLVRYELPDFVGSLFPISTEPEHSYIAGLSMGGMGTITQSFTHPEDFAAAGIFSMGFTSPPGSDEPSPYEGMLREAVAAGKKMPKYYLAVGKDDFLYGAAQKAKEVMEELGVDVTYDEIEGYGHEWPFWDIQIQKFLEWIPRTDAYADNRNRRL